MLASFGIGNMTQANSVAANVNGEWNVAEPVTGAVMVVLAAVVIVGGIKSLGRVTSFLVPVMIVVYILGAASVLALNIGESPAAFGVIFTDAFTGTAATGGFAGAAVAAAIRYGVARGIFSNESGLGTRGSGEDHPPRSAGARVDDPDLHRHAGGGELHRADHRCYRRVERRRTR